MRTDESDINQLLFKFKMSNEPERVAANVKGYPATFQNACFCELFLHICRRFPGGIEDIFIPYFQVLLNLGMLTQKSLSVPLAKILFISNG